MKSIIQEMYYGNICGNDTTIPLEKSKKELKLYDKLKSILPDEHMKLLDSLIEAITDRNGLEHCEAFTKGVKIGLLLGIEINQEEN